MNKNLAALLGAAAALSTVGGAQASQVQSTEPAASPSSGPTSYAELLDPIPNALALLKDDDARRAETGAGEVQLAQYRRYHDHHHHHHHHHQVYRRYFPPPRYYDHHHHHHHHHHHSHYYHR